MTQIVEPNAITEVLRTAVGRLGREVPTSEPVSDLVERLNEVTADAAERLSVAETRVQALVELFSAVAEGVVMIDSDGAVVHESGLAVPWLTGRSHGDVAGDTLAEVLEIAASGRSTSRTLELIGPPRRSLGITGVPVWDSAGDPSGAVAVLQDTTEDRHLEAARRDFVANVSHELKTPVGALGLLAETMLMERDPEVLERLARRMQLEALRVGQVIDDLLNLSRIEANTDTELELVNCGTLIETAVSRVRFAAEHRSTSIEVSGNLGANIYGDERELLSALHHLLENALKYSNESSVIEIHVSSDGAWTELSVRDHGVGIASRYLERIFERFYRVDDARTRTSGGTGLGLAIVRHVVQNHGGEVRVTSQEGEGSTFTLRLAATPANASSRLVIEGGADG